jgi:hypothetical protein
MTHEDGTSLKGLIYLLLLVMKMTGVRESGVAKG